ncbi:BTAD domain-containing putative transcriptional regulator [Mycolicibacterium gilvum]|uniref:BTAD domain-containing putative transcriptional regulator n=1 Tax=Mycolicibacterium gilvum TaxID=1804 RepID=UPI0040451FCC
MELGVLGPLHVRQFGLPVAIPGAKPRSILTMLGLHGGAVVPADTLVELLWGTDPPRTAAKALQTHISTLRRALGDGFVLTQGTGWALNEAEIDAVRYTEAARQGREAMAAGDASRAVACFDEARKLWRGAPELPDGRHGETARTRWIEGHAALVEDRAEALLATGRAAEIIGELEAAIADAPLRERRWGQLMLALYRAGRQSEALGAYRRVRSLLADELGVDPGPDLRRLESKIVVQDVSLEIPASQHGSSVMRAVTFLLTDIEGSTAAWEADADAMGEALARHDEIIEQAVTFRGGRLIKTRGEGDATFSVFDRPSAAAAAAVELQEAIRREPWALAGPMRIRIALHTGEVEFRDGDYFGRAVNRAARLRSLALGGQTLCSGATAELVIDSLADDIALVDLGMRRLKNLTRPEHVFELRLDTTDGSGVATVEVPAVDRPDLPVALAGGGPFVGRGSELARLLESWHVTLGTGTCAVLIAGEPGVGKTRLAGEWSRQAHDQAAIVLYGRCDEDLGAPYQPFAEALRTLVPCMGSNRLRGLRGVESLLPLVPDLTEVLPDLAAAPRAAPDTERYALFDAVVALLGVASASAPIVLVLDDLHWAAKPSLLLLRHLLRFGENARVQIVGTYRSTDLDRAHPLAAMLADLHRDGSATRLTLGGLGESDVTAYVAEAGYDDDQLARALASVTGGNPFFLIEALRHVDESGGRWDPNSLPQGVREAVSRRLSRLPVETNKALAAAAVVGSRFAVDLVERVVEQDLVDAFDEAGKAGILIEEPGGLYRFNHAIVRQSLLAELASVRRMRLHHKIAVALESEPDADGALLAELAYHYFECAWAGNAGKAVEYCRRAADQAMARLGYEGAADLYDKALHALEELDDEPPDRDDQQAELLVARCEALLAAGDVVSATGAVAQLLAAAGDSARLAAWGTCFGGQLSMLTDPERLDEIEVAVGAAAGALAELDDAAGEAKAHTVRAGCLARLGRIGDCETALDQALTAARRAHEHRRVNAVLAGAPLAALWGPNPVPRAGGRCLDVVRLLRITTGSPVVEATSTRCQGVLDALRGRAAAGRQLIDSARRTLNELGMRHAVLEVEQFAGIVELIADEPAAAEAHLRRAYQGFRRMGLEADTAETAALLARACLALGRDAEADELCTVSERLAGHAFKAAIAWRSVRAQLLSRRGDHGEARRTAEEAVAIAERTDALVDHGDARLALATVLGAAGDTAGARAAANRAADLYELKGAAALAGKARGLNVARDAPSAAAPADPVTVEADTECVRTILRLDAAVDHKEWSAFEHLFAPSVSVESRRKVVGFDRLVFTSTECAHEIRRICETDAVRRRHEIVAVRGERLALTRMAMGTSDESPGAAQDELLELFGLDASNRLSLLVSFDVEDSDAALAEIDALHAQSVQVDHRRQPANAASRVDARFNAIFAERRWEDIDSILRDDTRVEDRRAGLRREITYDRASAAVEIQAMAALGVQTMTSVVVAVRGERLVLSRTRYAGRDPRPDAFHTDVLRITEIDSDERCVASVVFDVDDLDAAIAELDSRYLAGEAAPCAHSYSVVAQGFSAVRRRELPAMTTDFVDIDHRSVAGMGAGDLNAYLRTAFDDLAEYSLYVASIHRLTAAGAVVTHVVQGISHEGLDAEWRLTDVLMIDGNLVNRCEIFDETDLDAALARFDELTRPMPRLANAASRVYGLLSEYFSIGDWAALSKVMSANMIDDDRRRVVNAEVRRGRDAVITSWSAVAATGTDVHASTVLATRGERLALCHSTITGSEQGAFQIEFLGIVEIDSDEKVVAHVGFDIDDIDDAITELDARYIAGEAAGHAQTWTLVAGVYAAFNRMELPSTTPDCVSVDHRRGAGFASGELSTYLQAAWEDSPGTRIHIEAVHRLSDHGVVVTHAAKGVSREGFEAEWRDIAVGTFVNGMLSRSELFDHDDLDAALARFDELSRSARQWDNAACREYVRFITSYSTGDWDTLAQVLADDITVDDRRRFVGTGVQTGRSAVVVNMQVTAELGVTQCSWTVVAIRGDCLALVRARFWGRGERPDAFSAEVLHLVEIESTQRITRFLAFDLDDLDAAFTELDARYLAGESAEHGDTWSVIADTFAAVNRGEAPGVAPDWVNVDHRHGAHAAAPGDLMAHTRANWGDSTDFTVRIEAVHALNRFGAVVAYFASGTSTQGFQAEWREVSVSVVEDGHVNRCELFDEADLAIALARFDELGRPAQRQENAASRAYARFVNCYTSGDWDALAQTMAEDFTADDRRRLVGSGLQPGRNAAVSQARVTSDLGVRSAIWSTVATRGERLVLARARFWGRDEPPDAFYTEVLHLVEIAASQRITRFVAFDLDHLDAAFVELDARYLAGEAAPHSRAWSVITQGYSAMAQGEMPGTTEKLATVDHRHVVPMASDAGIAYLRASFDLAPEFTLRIEAVHRLSDVGAVFTRWSTGTSREGFEAEWRAVDVVTVQGDLISGGEIFDEADLGAALRRFDEISSSAPRLENEASRVCARYRAAFAARDWGAAAELLAENLHNEDRRQVVNAGIRHGRESALDDLRVSADLGIPYFTAEEIAIRGERLALTRGRTPYDERPGSFLVDTVQIAEIDADGRIAAVVMFGPDDIDPAFAELEARYLAGEAAGHAHIWATIADTFTALNRRELPEVAPGWVSIDHRRGARASAPGDLLARTRATLEDSPDFKVYIEGVHTLNRFGAVVTYFACGTSVQGFQAEWREVSVSTVEGGRVNRTELFDEADLDRALARFDEIGLSPACLDNAARQMFERWVRSFTARDWDGMADLMADTVVHHDRRRVVNGGTQRGRDAVLANMRAIADVGVTNIEPSVVASRGDRVVLISQRVSGDRRPEAFGTDVLMVLAVDAENRFAVGVAFDVDDIDAAFAELDARYLADEGAAHTRAWSVIVNANAAFNRREMPATTADWVNADHRRGGMSFAPGDLSAYMRATWDVAADISNRIVAVHRLSSRGAAFTQLVQASSHLGFGGEWRDVVVMSVDGDLIDRCETFDEADLDTALARFDELGRPPAPPLENAASRVCERLRAEFAARDWDAIAETLADVLLNEDRRRVVNAGVRRGRDSMLKDLRSAADLGIRKFTGIEVATRGERLVLYRAEARHDEQTGAFCVENLVIVEIDADERVAIQVVFDVDDLDAAFAELDARYLAGEAAAHAHTWSLVVNTYAAFNRHELSKTTPDWVNVDHRLGVGSAPGDMNTYVSAFWDLVPDICTRIVAVHRLTDLGAVFVHTESGRSSAGFDAEWRENALLTFDGDAINRCELFGETDLTAALAQFDELSRLSAPAMENAATHTWARLTDAFNRRDMNGMLALTWAGGELDDRRTGVRDFQHGSTRQRILETLFEYPTSWHLEIEHIAVRGSRLCLSRQTIRDTGEADRPVTIELLTVLEVGEDGVAQVFVNFDACDLDGAVGELTDRWIASGEVAHPDVIRAAYRVGTAYNRHDWDAVAVLEGGACYVNHRQLATEEPETIGDHWRSIRALAELIPDMRIAHAEIYAHSATGLLGHVVVIDADTEGAAIELPAITLVIFDGSRVRHMEAFDLDQYDRALARFAELKSARCPRDCF